MHPPKRMNDRQEIYISSGRRLYFWEVCFPPAESDKKERALCTLHILGKKGPEVWAGREISNVKRLPIFNFHFRLVCQNIFNQSVPKRVSTLSFHISTTKVVSAGGHLDSTFHFPRKKAFRRKVKN